MKEECQHSIFYSDPNGRYIILEIKILDREFLLCSIYGPNTDQPQFFVEVFKKLADTEIKEIVLAGDFNIALNVDLDRIDKTRYAPNAHKILSQLIDEFELMDLWRIQNPDSKTFSWYQNRDREIGSKIDYFLVSQGIANNTENISYKYGF